jgi:hypothetical protein
MNPMLEQSLFAFLAAGGAAAGLTGALKSFPAIRFGWREGDEGMRRTPSPSIPILAQAGSSVVALYENAFRHDDGAFTAGWKVDLSPTHYAEDGTVNFLYDRWQAILNLPKPARTVVQLRISTVPDGGNRFVEHLSVCPADNVYGPARSLHEMEIAHHLARCAEGRFRRLTALLFVRIPVNRGNRIFARESVLANAFMENLRQGIPGLLRFQRDARESLQPLVQRLEHDETAAFETASQVWRTIERESPLPLTRMTREEMWRAYFLSHNPSAKSVPATAAAKIWDVRGYACDGAAYEENFVIHGDVPVAVVTMTRPPQSRIVEGGPLGSYAGCMRSLAGNPNWTFPHTHVFEHVTMGEEEARRNLRRRERSLRASGNAAFQKINRPSREAQAALGALDGVASEIAAGSAQLGWLRAYTIVYGENRRQDESLELLNARCEAIEASWRTVAGANAVRDNGAILRMSHPKGLIGECDANVTGAEVQETNPGLAALFPLERGLEASPPCQLFFRSGQGNIAGFDLSDLLKPTGAIVAPTGGGKSVLGGALLNACLATMPEARANVIDFGSFRNYGNVVAANWIRFDPDLPAGFNIWWHPDVENGVLPDVAHVNLVIEDIMILAGLKDDDALGRGLIREIVGLVFENECAKNQPGCNDPSEPRLSHFLRRLELVKQSQRYDSDQAKQKIETILLALNAWKGNAWLDAPMDDRYKTDSPLTIYDMQTLKSFGREIQRSLAFRVASRVLNSLGRRLGEKRTPTVNLFDELKRITDDFPEILKAAQIGVREGRKDNTFTFFLAQTYADLAGMPGVLANLGAFILGLQNGEAPDLYKQAGLSEDAIHAVRNLHNVPGESAQFLISVGGGDQRQTQLVEFELSPILLWALTSHPSETNAIDQVQRLKPDWSVIRIVTRLSLRFPQGLRKLKLTALPDSFIQELQSLA